MSCSQDPPPSRYSCNASPHKETGPFPRPFSSSSHSARFQGSPGLSAHRWRQHRTRSPFQRPASRVCSISTTSPPASGPVQQLKVDRRRAFRACPHSDNIVMSSRRLFRESRLIFLVVQARHSSLRISMKLTLSHQLSIACIIFSSSLKSKFPPPGRHGRWQMSSGRGFDPVRYISGNVPNL